MRIPPGHLPTHAASIRILELFAIMLADQGTTIESAAEWLGCSTKTVERYEVAMLKALDKSEALQKLVGGKSLKLRRAQPKISRDFNFRKYRRRMPRAESRKHFRFS